MVTKTENTAQENATLQQDKYSHDNLMIYRTSLALMKTLVDKGIFTEIEYKKICTKLTKNHGLSSCSIFAEIT